MRRSAAGAHSVCKSSSRYSDRSIASLRRAQAPRAYARWPALRPVPVSHGLRPRGAGGGSPLPNSTARSWTTPDMSELYLEMDAVNRTLGAHVGSLDMVEARWRETLRTGARGGRGRAGRAAPATARERRQHANRGAASARGRRAGPCRSSDHRVGPRPTGDRLRFGYGRPAGEPRSRCWPPRNAACTAMASSLSSNSASSIRVQTRSLNFSAVAESGASRRALAPWRRCRGSPPRGGDRSSVQFIAISSYRVTS